MNPNDRFSKLTLQKTLRYAEMIRITERKRFGQRLQMIICLRENRKNANIGNQFSKLTRRKTFKNDEIVISPKRKTPRHSGPLSNYLLLCIKCIFSLYDVLGETWSGAKVGIQFENNMGKNTWTRKTHNEKE